MWVGTQEPALLLCIPSDSEEVIPMPHFDRVKARAPFSCLLVQLIPSLIPFRWSSETRWLCYTQLPSNSSVHSERTTCRGSLVWNEPVLLALSKNLIETKLEKECFKKSLHKETKGKLELSIFMQIGICWAFPDIRHFSLMFIPSLGKSRLKTVGKKNHDAAQPGHQNLL